MLVLTRLVALVGALSLGGGWAIVASAETLHATASQDVADADCTDCGDCDDCLSCPPSGAALSTPAPTVAPIHHATRSAVGVARPVLPAHGADIFHPPTA